jgi:hypothetical protein
MPDDEGVTRARDRDRDADTARFRDRPLIRDALYTILLMFPAAALTALVYRFPVPFGGLVRGPAGVWEAILATLVYGLAGGFIVVPVVAIGLGFLLRRSGYPAHGPMALVPPFAVSLLFAIGLTLVLS